MQPIQFGARSTPPEQPKARRPSPRPRSDRASSPGRSVDSARPAHPRARGRARGEGRRSSSGDGRRRGSTICGRANGGNFGSSVCSSSVTSKPAERIVSSVGRLLQSQHDEPVDRVHPVLHLRHERVVRANVLHEDEQPAGPEDSAELAQHWLPVWSSPQSTSVETTVCWLASSNGRSSPGARAGRSPASSARGLSTLFSHFGIGLPAPVTVSDSTPAP